jgi:hypothetical protein
MSGRRSGNCAAFLFWGATMTRGCGRRWGSWAWWGNKKAREETRAFLKQFVTVG